MAIICEVNDLSLQRRFFFNLMGAFLFFVVLLVPSID